MSTETADQIRARALQHISVGEIEEACAAFAQAAEVDPDSADGWVNLATAERAVGRFHLAEEHYRRAIALLERTAAADRGLLASALHALGSTYEGLELTAKAAESYRRSAAVDPRAPTPLAALSMLLARAGHLEEAGKVATDYCLAAVSILAEKGNIAQVRQFQKALKQASTVDGGVLLAATREAYVRSFAQTVAKLPEGVHLEAEPMRKDEAGKPVPVVPNPRRPFARVRFDAIQPSTGERWMIQDSPTYGFPANCPAASEGLFSVPLAATTPFPVRVSTRTAWDYFFVRLRFANGLGPKTLERAERHLGGWYERGFTGAFADGGRGFFHFLSEPFPIGEDGLRYEIDLGLTTTEAAAALFDALAALHAEEPLATVMLGEAALP